MDSSGQSPVGPVWLVENWIPVGQLASFLTSRSGCIMVAVQMRSALFGIRFTVACLCHWPHLIHPSTCPCDVVLLMITGCCVCVSHFSREIPELMQVYFLTLSAFLSLFLAFLNVLLGKHYSQATLTITAQFMIVTDVVKLKNSSLLLSRCFCHKGTKMKTLCMEASPLTH